MAEATPNIYERLRKAQLELKAPKSQYNSFGKYSYRNVEDIIEAAKPVLAEVGLTLIVSDELVNVGDRYYVRARASVHVQEGTNGVYVDGYAREEETKKGMDGAQITGAASSYARKYALNGLLAIDDTKDADSDQPKQPTATKRPPVQRTAEPAPAAPAPANAITSQQLKKMMAMFNELGIKEREARLRYVQGAIGREVETSNDLTKPEAVTVIDKLDDDLFYLNSQGGEVPS